MESKQEVTIFAVSKMFVLFWSQTTHRIPDPEETSLAKSVIESCTMRHQVRQAMDRSFCFELVKCVRRAYGVVLDGSKHNSEDFRAILVIPRYEEMYFIKGYVLIATVERVVYTCFPRKASVPIMLAILM